MGSAYDPRITAYFGDAVLRAGFMPTPHLFLRHYAQLGLGHGEAMFVLQLMEINWDLAAPPKTVNDIAQRMGVNARTVRRYSEAVAELGLITLYDQYDGSGAQIENGYDLSPLFERLATFAPEPPLGGQTRRRERRAPQGNTPVSQREASAQVAVNPSRRPPDISVTPTPDIVVSHPPDISVTPAPDILAKGRADESIIGPRIDSSGLKKEKRILQEQDIMMHDESSAHGGNNGPRPIHAVPGWSLRRGQPLTADEVSQTDMILQRIGIDVPVRSRIRTSLAPSEAWTLWAYALAKRWSIPLLINAVYDKARRQARPADIPNHYDAAGTALARLDPDRADQLLRLVAEHCPDASMMPCMEVLGTPPMPDTIEALEAVWRMIAELRKASGKPCPFPAAAPGQVVAMPAATITRTAATWQQALAHLRQALPASEFLTWFQDAALVDLTGERAVVGVPNIFAREQLTRCYQAQIAQALHAICGRSVQVQIELAG